MLIMSAKSGSMRGTSRYPVFMSNCLTISHTCYPYLPSTGIHIFVSGVTEKNEDVKWI